MSFIGVSTFVTDQTIRNIEAKEAVTFGGKVLGELASTIARRCVEDYQGAVQVVRHPALKETEFRLELNIFTNAQLDEYYKERRKAEDSVASVIH